MPISFRRAINVNTGDGYDNVGAFFLGDVSAEISEWLSSHPSVFSQYDYVTPEMYGAIGDGVTDDTSAWQAAVNSGKKVRAASSKYRCGTIYVTTDADIDCNNAEFSCKDVTLFDCRGTSESGTTEADYTANGDYTLTDTFTGIAYISGTNNVFKHRSYYRGGSVEHFHDGKLDTQIPIDITGVTVYRLNTIQVNIRNIANVVFDGANSLRIIYQEYCAYSVIENVNMTSLCYSVVNFDRCFKCTYRDSHFDTPQYHTYGDYYYPVAIYDSCYTTIENIHGHNVGWHCITTSGQTLCRGTKVVNCELYCDYPIPAYGDHPNGVETTITGSTLSSAGLGPLGRLTNCDIVCCKENDMCHVNLSVCSVDGLGVHTIESCRFYPQNSQYAAVRILCDPNDEGLSYDYYYNHLAVSNCRNMVPAVPMNIKKLAFIRVTGEVTVDTVSVMNTNLPVESGTAEHIYVYP